MTYRIDRIAGQKRQRHDGGRHSVVNRRRQKRMLVVRLPYQIKRSFRRRGDGNVLVEGNDQRSH